MRNTESLRLPVTGRPYRQQVPCEPLPNEPARPRLYIYEDSVMAPDAIPEDYLRGC